MSIQVDKGIDYIRIRDVLGKYMRDKEDLDQHMEVIKALGDVDAELALIYIMGLLEYYSIPIKAPDWKTILQALGIKK